MRFRFSDLLLFVLIFVFVTAFPVDLIPVNLFWQLMIRIGLRLMLLGYYIYIIIKNRMKVFGVANIINVLLCIPFVLISFSNITASLIDGGFSGVIEENSVFVAKIIMTLLIAISEEIVFRLFIHNSLYNTSSIKRIFASAGIFALMHLLNIVNVRYLEALVTVLLQTVYTFGLGLLLGVLYEYGHSLTGAILLHFCFNFFNETLYEYLGGYCSNAAFYLTAVGYTIVVGVYAALITMFYFRKYNIYYRS